MDEGRAIVAASGGVPGKALALIDSDVAVMEKKLLAIATSGDPENRLREALAREVGGTSNRARLELVIDIVPGLLSRIARERPIAEIAPVLAQRSEEHTSELQSLMRISYAVFCLKKKNKQQQNT